MIIKSRLKSSYKKHAVQYFFFYVHKVKLIYKRLIELMIKLIFYYQVRQEGITFFENGRKLWRDDNKNNTYFYL